MKAYFVFLALFLFSGCHGAGTAPSDARLPQTNSGGDSINNGDEGFKRGYESRKDYNGIPSRLRRYYSPSLFPPKGRLVPPPAHFS